MAHIRRTPWQIQRAVVFALMMRELKTRFEGRLVGGVVWMIGLPLVELLVFLWVNTIIRGRLHREGYEFIVWLLVAMLPYQLFRSLWSKLSNAPSSNRGLFGFKQVKPMDTFIARALLEITIQVVTFVMVALVLSRMGYSGLLPRDVLAYLLVVAQLSLIGIGLGMIWAVVVDFSPHFNSVTQLIAMPLMFISGVIFPLHSLPQEFTGWLMLNPILHLVELSRHAYLPGYVMVQGVNPVYPMVVSVVLLSLAMALYTLRRRHLGS